ncbi:unnamed protein product [Owenia fusiformis]|uniref:Uncharacterized protein n=1 Tax=Owenia fusiformis TaxID=6347 RepID=A0A8J1Y360_OWEFU|nr:unnamed protein product [Owenia fusiformis]
MSQTYERVIQLIETPPGERSTKEINIILPWLQKKSQLLQDMEKDILIDIVRNCQHLKAVCDDVIIRQGEIGDCFFIILNGSVAVYVDASKSGEDEKSTEEPDDKLLRNKRKERAKENKPLERNKLGKFVIKFDVGRSFGEIALISEDAKRNATIVADEETDFLVINRDLYNSTLKASQEQEYAERESFVQTHPFFAKWSNKFKKLLEMSIVKENYSYDTPIVKQGDPFNGLYFLRKGRAQIILEPSRHAQQYPSSYPFIASHDLFELESINSVKKAYATKDHPDVTKTPVKQDQVLVRRRDGYAAAENRIHHKTIGLCFVEEGETLGDLELIMNLGSYYSTIICTAQTEVYLLNIKNFDRLVSKRNPLTLDIVKEHVITKLKGRVDSVQGAEVPLLKHSLFKLTDNRKPVAKKAVSLRTRKDLPDHDLLTQHLLEVFIQNKAELIEPYVPGAVYLREKMREMARIRENVRQRRLAQGRLKEIPKRKTERKPRSIPALREALRRQEMNDEEKEKEMLKEILEKLKVLQDVNDTLEFNDEPEKSMDLKIKADNKSTPSYEIQNSDTQKKQTELPQPLQLNNLVERSSKPSFSTPIEKANTIESGANKRILPPISEESNANENINIDDIDSHSLPLLGKREKSFVTETDHRDHFLPPAKTSTHEQTKNNEYDVIKDKQRKSESPQKEKVKMKFINAYVKDKIARIDDKVDFNDYETNDTTLSYLEERLKKFHLKTRKPKSAKRIRSSIKLPKLRRYVVPDSMGVQQPKPGGRVLMKLKECKLNTTSHRNHEHFKYHMVPELPDTVKKENSRLVMEMFMKTSLGKKAATKRLSQVSYEET